MKRPEFNKWYSLLRKLLHQHEDLYSFKLSTYYLKTVKATLESLQQQEDQFAQFVIKKQSEIDEIPERLVKIKMQEHLDKITIHTHNHFNKLMDKYQWLIQRDGDWEKNFNFLGNKD